MSPRDALRLRVLGVEDWMSPRDGLRLRVLWTVIAFEMDSLAI